MAEEKINKLDRLTLELEKIVNKETYKEDFYKDDDVTYKEKINQKKVDEHMEYVYSVKMHVKELYDELSNMEDLTIPTSIETKFYEVDSKSDEFYLKGSSNFKSGFLNPTFYIDKDTLFFSVTTPENKVDYATVTRTNPGEKPNPPVEYGGEIKDGLYVDMPVQVEIGFGKVKPGTTYVIYLISTSGEITSFNYIYQA
jgi:hypothetical protein